MPFSNAFFGKTKRQYFGRETTGVQTQQIFIAITRSLVSPTVPLTIPLSEDRQGKLYVNWDNWTIGGLYIEGSDHNDLAWQKSQFEVILQIVSELRHKLRLIDEFFADPPSFAKGINLLLDPDSMVTSVCDALSFFAEAKTIAIKMLETPPQFSGCHFDAFLQTMKKRFSEFPPYLEQLLKSKGQRTTKNSSFCTFWSDFLQHLDFWPIYGIEHPMPVWKAALFDGLVHLLGKYLTLRLKWSSNGTADCANLGFLESIWMDDELIISRVNFVTNCGQTNLLKTLEENGQLLPFHETFIAHLDQFKEDGRLRFTRCFLVQLVRQSLVSHSIQLDKILLNYLTKDNLLREQLNFIINVTSLNSYWVRENSELFDDNGSSEKGINETFAKQFWPLQILLGQQLYKHLFTVCAHLRRIEHSLLQLMDFIAIGHSRWRERFRRRLSPKATADVLKGRLRQALGAQLMGQLQQLFQLLFAYFFSLNSFYAHALTENIENPPKNDENIHFNVLTEVVAKWESALTNLLVVFEDIFRDPIVELLQLIDAFCCYFNAVYPSVCPLTTENGYDVQRLNVEDVLCEEDAELRLLVEWSDRLRRVQLFIKHRQPFLTLLIF